MFNKIKLNIINFLKTNLFFFILLFIVVFLLYGKAINYEFINLDEDSLIVKNIDNLSNIKNIPSFFLTSCYLTKTSSYYRPILVASFSVETCLFGLNIKIYHLTNILLFIISLYLIYIFLLQLNMNGFIIKFIILLMSVHPMFSTLAVWIPGRNDTLLTIFILMSFIEFIRYLKFNKKIDFLLLILFFALALFTKESAIFLFIFYPLFVYCFKYNISKKQIMGVCFIFVSIIIIYFYLRSLSVVGIDIKNYFSNFYKYFKNMIWGLSNYMFLSFIPTFIPTMLFDEMIKLKDICIVVISCLFTIIIYYKNIKYRKIIFFSITWFILFLLPTFFQKEYVFLTHRMFISSIGLVIILSILIETLIKKYPVIKKYFYILFVIIFILLFSFSFLFDRLYSNKSIYWTQAYIDAPKYHWASYRLAKIYLDAGNYEKYKEFMFNAYNLSTGDQHLFDIFPILIYEGRIDEVKQICFNIIDNNNDKLFLIIGANRTLGELYLQENNLNLAYKYLKTAYDLNKFDLSLKNKLDEIQKEINRN